MPFKGRIKRRPSQQAKNPNTQMGSNIEGAPTNSKAKLENVAEAAVERLSEKAKTPKTQMESNVEGAPTNSKSTRASTPLSDT